MRGGHRVPFDTLVLMAAKSWGVHPETVLEGDAYWLNRLIKENNIRAELQVPLL